jgi:uroporphyrinogen III methyltransferase/synthase
MRLQGLRIIVTRSQTQAAGLKDLLQKEGAIVFEVPAIKIVPDEKAIMDLRNKLKQIQDYEWLVLTSVNSVEILQECGVDWNVVKVACIGKATAKKVEEFGGSVTIVPPEFRAESLSEQLRKQNLSGVKILLPRAAGSRMVLPDELTKAGAIVDEVHIYKAAAAEESKTVLKDLLESSSIDYVTFTSSSTVKNFAELAGNLPWQKIPAACIGPITAETLRDYGVEPAIEAEEFTMEGLVKAIAGSAGFSRHS